MAAILPTSALAYKANPVGGSCYMIPLRAAFTDAGRRLPELWHGSALTAARKKALLRCLIDEVVIHRSAPDNIHVRIVWRGGDASVLDIPAAVGSLAALARHAELEARVLELARAGHSDEAIAAKLTADGHRSPMRDRVLPSTVRIIRLRHGILLKRSQSHPRRLPGRLTIPQLAAQLGVSAHWIYDHLHNGTIAIARDEHTGLYLFPDARGTLDRLQKLRAGELNSARIRHRAGFLRRAARCVIEERPDVGVADPVDPPLPQPIRKRVQRIVLSAPGPEPIAEPQELRLADRRQKRHHSRLDDLVFQCGNAERTLPAVRLRNVPSAGGQRSIRSSMHAGMEVPEVRLQSLRVPRPRQAINSWRSGLLQAEEARPEDIEVDVVEERCKRLLPIPGCGSSYAGLRT